MLSEKWCLSGWWKQAAAGLALWAVFVGAASAHPHVFVTTKVEIILDTGGKVVALRHSWTFDELYSAFLGQGLDKNGDGKLSRDELAELAKVNVESLADTAFFTSAKLKGKVLTFGAPTDYFLEGDGKALTLNYTLPLETPQPVGAAFTIEVIDPTFFVSFTLSDDADAAKLTGAPAGCKLTVKRPEKSAATTLSKLGESFFQGISGKTADMVALTAARVLVACP
jgi:ABC-type uncharacterized transport system substrate-binding protein